MKKGDEVSWKWGNGKAHGTIESVHTETIERKIKGEAITRKGTEDNPALVIKQEDGDKVLKLASEVDKK
ncbi:DUF2945 domain-containing protein [Siphonobacter sp.]|uniref:DUF2945 domain-containing protein n=1 Tax=Siphonobacter sp. TaxID=1869184 RepID=UPI003B3A4C1F